MSTIQSLGADVLIVSGIDVYFDDKNEIMEDSLRTFPLRNVTKIHPNHTYSHH